MADAAGLLLALQMGDSAFPSGGFGFSWGLETLKADGLVRDGAGVTAFATAQLTRRWASADGRRGRGRAIECPQRGRGAAAAARRSATEAQRPPFRGQPVSGQPEVSQASVEEMCGTALEMSRFGWA